MFGLKQAAARARSRRGESIVEVLIALLVGALAILMLASMTTAATNAIKSSQSKIDEYAHEENRLAEQMDDEEDGEIDVELTRELFGGGEARIPVQYYVNTMGKETIVSYKG